MDEIVLSLSLNKWREKIAFFPSMFSMFHYLFFFFLKLKKKKFSIISVSLSLQRHKSTIVFYRKYSNILNWFSFVFVKTYLRYYKYWKFLLVLYVAFALKCSTSRAIEREYFHHIFIFFWMSSILNVFYGCFLSFSFSFFKFSFHSLCFQ